MISSIVIMLLLSISGVFTKGGTPKCVVCPPCMVCDQFIGCVYNNFTPCLVNNAKGYCINGGCNTTIGNLTLTKPPICKTYKISKVVVNNTTKYTTSTVNDINGLSCTQPGAILESVCMKGTCTPYTLGIDRLGNPTGCRGFPDGFLCDTNFVFTDGEKCINQNCVIPENSNTLCVL